jgi:hemerythrin
MVNVLVEWSDDFSAGNRQIDQQHKELVRMTNDLYAGCQMGGVMAKVYLLKSIQGAVHYVRTHFSTEEDIMVKADYPGFAEHKQQHDDFVAEVSVQIRKFEKDDNPDPAGFVKYLMDWIMQHIAVSDKGYVPYIARMAPDCDTKRVKGGELVFSEGSALNRSLERFLVSRGMQIVK